MKKSQFRIPTGALLGISILVAGSFALLTGQENLPAADAQEVWTYLTETNPYTDWQPWPGHDGYEPGTSPHGAFLKIYVNDAAMDAIERGNPMPSGAILVKENYGPERALLGVTPMYRVADYNPDAGNWFWAKYGADGSVETSGKVQSCIDCHSSAGGNDYLFTETP